ncbi:MAG: DUF5668 domain-containing protein [Cyclobacteriaceae bacterium]
MSTNEGNTGNRNDCGVPTGRSGKILSGLILVTVGAVLLANQFGAQIPRWIISWPMLLIVIGFYVGAKHSFRNWGWLIPIGIGSFFLLDRIVPELSFRPYIWPVVIIGVGLFIMLNPGSGLTGRRSRRKRLFLAEEKSGQENSDDYLNSVTVFGGIEKNMVTKNFKGGEVTTFFGGSSINMSQADIEDKATLEITQMFGGFELVIPAHWKVQSEVVSVFGGFEDKRAPLKEHTAEKTKTLIIKGTSIFGGIDIKSF